MNIEIENASLGYKAVLSFVHRRIQLNKNCIIVVNGATVSGKSYASLKLAQDLSLLNDRPFTIKDNVAFNFETLLKQIKSGNEDDDSAGRVFVFEEVGSYGSGAAARQWQGKLNMFFNSFLQTARHRRQVFILNCPFFSNLDSASRKLCHLQIEAQGFNPASLLGFLKVYRIQTNTRDEKMYFKYLRVVNNSSKSKVRGVKIQLAEKKLLREYESVKKDFTNKLNSVLESEIEKSNKPKEKGHVNSKFHLYSSEKDIELKKTGLLDEQIATIFGVKRVSLYKYRRIVKAKLTVEP